MSNDAYRTWLSVDVVAESAATEAIEFAFNSLDACGTAIDQLRKAGAKTVTVTGYFDELPEEDILRDVLQNALRIYNFDASAILDISYGEIEDADWLAEWKKHWRPTTVGRFLIAPPWADVVEADKIVIRIEPSMAFGTGTHETTQLCLTAIDEHYAPNMSLLDVGTGTGILAIAAAKIQGKSQRSQVKISAVDLDKDSIEIAEENAVANGVGDKIEFIAGSITSETPKFDFVCANLTLDVIKPLLPLLVEKSRRILLLSGILVEQEGTIISELEKILSANFEINEAGEWLSVLVRKNSVLSVR